MEPDLLVRARAGDERAFEALTVTRHPGLFRVAFGITRDAELAEDATQRAFLEIWRWLPRMPDSARFEGWAAGHLLRTCRSLEAAQAAEDGQSSPDRLGPSGLDSYGAFVDRDQLSRGFRRLSFDDRAVLVLRLLAEMDEDDSGAALGIDAHIVQPRFESALEALDAVLDGDATPAQELTPQPEGV